MSRQVYIGKVKSNQFDYYKEYKDSEVTPLPERISKEKANYMLWSDIYSAVFNKIPNAKHAGYELNVIKFNKADLLAVAIFLSLASFFCALASSLTIF